MTMDIDMVKLLDGFEFEGNDNNMSIKIDEIPKDSLLHTKRNYEIWNDAKKKLDYADEDHDGFYM